MKFHPGSPVWQTDLCIWRLLRYQNTTQWFIVGWQIITAAVILSSSHSNRRVSSRNTVFMLQSNSPGVLACMWLASTAPCQLHIDRLNFFGSPLCWHPCCAARLASFKWMRGLHCFQAGHCLTYRRYTGGTDLSLFYINSCYILVLNVKHTFGT